MLSVCCIETSKEMNYDLNTFQCRETCLRIAEQAAVLLLSRARQAFKLVPVVKGVEDSWLCLWYWSFLTLFSVRIVLQMVLKSE